MPGQQSKSQLAIPMWLADDDLSPLGGSASPLNVSSRTVSSAGTDRSIVATTTSQTLMPANATRMRLLVRNDSAVDVWINFGAPAVATAGAGNYRIAANGGSLDLSGSSGAINIIAASATAAISAREF
jgi:hypothetical protein